MSLDADNGYPSCSAKPGGAGRAHDVKPDFFRDGGASFVIAKPHADALRVQRYGVMIGTAATPNTLHATWNIDDHRSGANDGSLPVPANAGTGNVEIVLK